MTTPRPAKRSATAKKTTAKQPPTSASAAAKRASKKTAAPTRTPAKTTAAKKPAARSANAATTRSAAEARSDSDARRAVIDAAYAAVPAIGKSWRRWYDFPYRFLYWLLRDWRRALLPQRVRDHILYRINWLLPFNEHDRNKAYPAMRRFHDFAVPADEHVVVPSLWIVELFPPSVAQPLADALGRNDWDRRRQIFGRDEPSSETLAKSRAGSGNYWWRLGAVMQPNVNYVWPEAVREKLPEPFDAVDLRAFQLGHSLTAVAARFLVADAHIDYLDRAWHAPHEPALVRRRGQRPRAEDQMTAAFRTTQAARYSLHEAARGWFAEKWPGFFASRGEAQPLIDMLLTDRVDPEAADGELDDALRALGLVDRGAYVETSKDMPKFVFARTDKVMTPGIKSTRTYAMWAQRDAAVAATRLDGYGSDPNRSLASRYSDEIEGFLTTLSISSMLTVLEADYAQLRDTARANHGRFRVATMERLRETFLTLSMDVTSIDRDLRQVWDRGPRPVEEAIFTLGWSPQFKQRAKTERWGALPTGTVNEWAREDQRAELARLCEMDRDYRDVLSTAASLGASVHASRSGRIALVVAVASLVVAAATLVVAAL